MKPANAAHDGEYAPAELEPLGGGGSSVPDDDRGERHRHQRDRADHEDHAQHLDVHRGGDEHAQQRKSVGPRDDPPAPAGQPSVGEQQRDEQRIRKQGGQPRPGREPAGDAVTGEPGLGVHPADGRRQHADRHDAEQPADGVVRLAPRDQHAEHGEDQQEERQFHGERDAGGIGSAPLQPEGRRCGEQHQHRDPDRGCQRPHVCGEEVHPASISDGAFRQRYGTSGLTPL